MQFMLPHSARQGLSNEPIIVAVAQKWMAVAQKFRDPENLGHPDR